MFLTSTSEGKVIRAEALNAHLVSLITEDQISGIKTTTFESMSVVQSLPYKNKKIADVALQKLATNTPLQFMSREKESLGLQIRPKSIDNLADFAYKSISPSICPVTLENATLKLLLAGPLLDLQTDLDLVPEAAIHLSNAKRVFEHYATDSLRDRVKPAAFIPVRLNQPSKILYQTQGNGNVYTTQTPSLALPVLVFEAKAGGETGAETDSLSTTALPLPLLCFLGENHTVLAPYDLISKIPK